MRSSSAFFSASARKLQNTAADGLIELRLADVVRQCPSPARLRDVCPPSAC
jgi:hypothetical protein